MHQNKVAIITRTVLRSEQIERLESQCKLAVHYDIPDPKPECIAERIGDSNIVVTNVWSPVTQEVLEECKFVKSILTCSAGTDHIDLEYCEKVGIHVSSYPDYCVNTMAEKALAFILMALNQIVPAVDHAKEGGWDYSAFQGRECCGITLGIMGYGKTGRRLGELATAIGINILHTNSKSSTDHVAHVLSTSDVVSLHMSANQQTRHFLNKKRLDLLKSDAIIVNVSRGSLVSDSDLLNFLIENDRSIAMLDVLEKEPPPINYPLIQCKRAIVTPHIAWNSSDAQKRLGDLLCSGILDAINQDGQGHEPERS